MKPSLDVSRSCCLGAILRTGVIAPFKRLSSGTITQGVSGNACLRLILALKSYFHSYPQCRDLYHFDLMTTVNKTAAMRETTRRMKRMLMRVYVPTASHGTLLTATGLQDGQRCCTL